MPSEWNGLDNASFVRRALIYLVEHNKDRVLSGRLIPKHLLYCNMSWWKRLSKDDTRRVMRLLAVTCEGVRFSNQGLFVPASYVGQHSWKITWPRPRSSVSLS